MFGRTYTAAQIQEAFDDIRFWLSKGAPIWVAAACAGSHDGEDSFNETLRGDNKSAGGMSQWHAARQQAILMNTGIDVWTEPVEKQREAMYAEISEPWSAYRHVWSALMATSDIVGAVTILVEKYEQSSSQARDIARRTDLANDWLTKFQGAPS
jgi:hypothetical protein